MTKEELKEQDIRLNKLCFDYQEKEKRIAELEKQIEKMKCCQNCKHCSEIISYKVLGGKEISKICSDGHYVCDKWEIKEK